MDCSPAKKAKVDDLSPSADVSQSGSGIMRSGADAEDSGTSSSAGAPVSSIRTEPEPLYADVGQNDNVRMRSADAEDSGTSASAADATISSVRTEPMNFSFEADRCDEIVIYRNPAAESICGISAEIWIDILALLPISDVLCKLNAVCKQFHALINDQKYLRYKKLFFKRKAKVATVDAELSVALSSLIEPQTCLLTIIFLPCISNFKKNSKKFETIEKTLSRMFEKFPAFQLAEQFLNDYQKAKSLPNGQKLTIWNYIAAAVLFADDVSTMSRILHRMLAPPYVVSNLDVTEFFYCLAYHLSVADSYHQNGPLRRILYNVYYTLFVYENDNSNLPFHYSLYDPDTTNNLAAQAPLVNLTYEQRLIVKHDVSPGECMRIIAFAGTGKTSVLREYARARPNQRFLIIFFNKAVCDAATSTFSKNALCRTIHSIAYQSMNVGTVYSRKLPIVSNLYTEKIKGLLQTGKPALKKIPELKIATLVRDTLMSFMLSAGEFITTAHVPNKYLTVKRVQDTRTVKVNDLEYGEQQALADLATGLWEKVIDPNCKLVGMLHDTYLKLFQLTKPDFRKIFAGRDVDVIMVDEAQDLNPTALDIVRLQTTYPKIVVGDPYQQIYRFRGCVNALDEFGATRTFYLTQSFRFGPGVAYVANAWLRTMKKESGNYLLGLKSAPTPKTPGPVTAIICRTNLGVFKECAAMTQREPKRRFHVLGGLDAMGLQLLEDIYALNLTRSSRLQLQAKTKAGQFFWNKFEDLKKLSDYADDALDKELMQKVHIVKKYSNSLPNIVQAIQRNFQHQKTACDLLITTTHKAKGLEFDRVYLSDDFGDILEMRENTSRTYVISSLQAVFADSDEDSDTDTQVVIKYRSSEARESLEEEINLLYVAVTRAKRDLILNKSVLRVLLVDDREAFQYLTRFGNVSSDTTSGWELQRCILCNKPLEKFTDSQIVLCRKQLEITNEALNCHRSRAGIQCKQCLADPNADFFVINEEAPAGQPPQLQLLKPKICFFKRCDPTTVAVQLDVPGLRRYSEHFAPFLS